MIDLVYFWLLEVVDLLPVSSATTKNVAVSVSVSKDSAPVPLSTPHVRSLGTYKS